MTAVKASFDLPFGKLCISQGNIVNFHGDAIVNAADHKCIYGKGVDGAINKAGGSALVAARRALPIVAGTRETRCPVGEARSTVGGQLPVKYVIHAVGPNFNPKANWVQQVAPNGDQLLYDAYAASMRCAKERGCATVCFSLLSAGFFRGSRPLHEVLVIAVRAIRAEAYPGLREAHLLAFSAQPNGPEASDVKTLRQAASSVGLPTASSAARGCGAAASTSSSSSSSSIAACFGKTAASAATAPAPAPATSLSEEQRARMAANSAAALARRQATSGSGGGAGGATAAAPAAPVPAAATTIEISDGDTEEDEVTEVPPPAVKKQRA